MRPDQLSATNAVKAFLEDLFGEAPDFAMVEDGETSWAFWIDPDDTTSYLNENLRIEWYGTCWEPGDKRPWLDRLMDALADAREEWTAITIGTGPEGVIRVAVENVDDEEVSVAMGDGSAARLLTEALEKMCSKEYETRSEEAAARLLDVAREPLK